MNKYALIFLRIGIASVFLYAAVAATFNPSSWIGYIPQFMRNILPGEILLRFFSFYEFVLGIWLLTGWRTFYSAILSSLTLFGIIVTNLGVFDITFRDVAILFSSISLALISKK